MEVERYSHVMHIVSRVEGTIENRVDCFDLFMAAFPAGTVTGAPKIRAMEIISELEPSPRGPYAGAVGYFGFNGNMDFCITIRTMTIVKINFLFRWERVLCRLLSRKGISRKPSKRPAPCLRPSKR